MSELAGRLAVGAWVKARAELATGLRAWLDVVPLAEPLPAVRWTILSEHDVRTVAQEVALTRFDTLIAVVVDEQETALDTLSDLELALAAGLHRAAGTAEGMRVYSCTRDSPWGQTERADGRTFRHAGGIYTIQARPA